MRIDTKETKVYPFDELSDTAQDSAVADLVDFIMDFEWWYSTYEDAATIGLKITEFDLGRGSFCRGNWTEYPEDAAQLILENHGKSCETYKDAWEFQNAVSVQGSIFMDRDDDKEFIESDQYEELCRKFHQDILEDYRIMLQKEYEYQTSREVIIETIKANEYEFTENGKLY